jgi:hypothetical protein
MRCSVGGIIQTKQTFSTVPRTRTQMRELDLGASPSWVLSEEESVVCESETSLSFIKITQSLIH